MDTHITDRPDRAEIQVEAAKEVLSGPQSGNEGARRNPFQPVHQQAAPRPETPEPALPQRGRRSGLLAMACGVVTLTVAGGVFWISPYNHYNLVDLEQAFSRVQEAAESTLPGATPPGPVAPAALLARAPEPTYPAASYQAPTCASGTSQRGDDMAEFLNFREGAAAPTPGPDREAAIATTAMPRASIPASHSATAAASVPVSPQAQPSAPSQAHPDLLNRSDEAAQRPVPAPVRGPMDAVAAVAALRPAPMTDAQQVQVLDLVTQLGTMLRDQRSEIAQLREDQQNLVQRVDGALNDFTRRMSLSEARGALGAASGEPRVRQAAGPLSGSASTGATPVAARSIVPAAAVTPVDPASYRYHVQAASPGLAMLSELDASGGEQRQLPIAPGDTVPGWGKVVSISQRGTSWVVKTDRGLIQ